jgi:hypothetical protein
VPADNQLWPADTAVRVLCNVTWIEWLRRTSLNDNGSNVVVGDATRRALAQAVILTALNRLVGSY